MAAMLQRECGVEAGLETGARGEFSIWVDDALVVKKGFWTFPKDSDVLDAVRGALAGKTS